MWRRRRRRKITTRPNDHSPSSSSSSSSQHDQALDYPMDKIVYVMTDIAKKSFNFWSKHEALKPFVEAGNLDWAVFDHHHDQRIRLMNAKKVGRPDDWVGGRASSG